MDQATLEKLWEMAPLFTEEAPHAKRLGIKFVSVARGRSTISLPYNASLIGNADTRVIHGGAVTTLLDQASGLAAIAGFDTPRMVATLNLSIDYMRSATPGETILAQAHCYKVTRHIAFVRCVAHDGDPDDPIATSQATFMCNVPNDPKPKAERTPKGASASPARKAG